MTTYRWASRGDINAFFGLILDNIAVLVLLVGTISRAGAGPDQPEAFFTPQFVVERMVPGTALGVSRPRGIAVTSGLPLRWASRKAIQV